MNHYKFAVVLLLIGFVVGWWANTLLNSKPQSLYRAAQQTAKVTARKLTDNPDENVLPAIADNNKKRTANVVEQFRYLLNQQAFEQAMSLYDEIESISEPVALSLKKIIHEQLLKYLQHKQNEAFMALIDLYLSRHYDDTDVLMILAEYQRLQGYPDEAARVFQLALTYAYQPAQQENISTALQTLIAKTDKLFSQQERWIELLGFYQLLETINLILPINRLRKAQLYQVTGDNDSARKILLSLLEDNQLQQKAQKLLASLDAVHDEAQQETQQDIVSTAIPLQRRGNHYLINLQLNDDIDVVLMIDTGASVTSLSQQSYARLSSRRHFNRLGSRLFNTANGVTKGHVYRIKNLILGEYNLNGVDLAVLDFQTQEGIDGLLGMNVLQYFRFEIDQDKQQLNLQPRASIK